MPEAKIDGFVLGTIRVLLVVPHIGTRAAELIETPVMILVSFLAARWIIRRLAVRPSTAERIAIGLVALVLMLGAEFTFVLWLRGLTISEYLATRDPVAGTAYVLLVVRKIRDQLYPVDGRGENRNVTPESELWWTTRQRVGEASVFERTRSGTNDNCSARP